MVKGELTKSTIGIGSVIVAFIVDKTNIESSLKLATMAFACVASLFTCISLAFTVRFKWRRNRLEINEKE